MFSRPLRPFSVPSRRWWQNDREKANGNDSADWERLECGCLGYNLYNHHHQDHHRHENTPNETSNNRTTENNTMGLTVMIATTIIMNISWWWLHNNDNHAITIIIVLIVNILIMSCFFTSPLVSCGSSGKIPERVVVGGGDCGNRDYIMTRSLWALRARLLVGGPLGRFRPFGPANTLSNG